jgi:acyl carrier protein
MNTTFERLHAILVKDYKVAPEALTMDAALESLGLDSLAIAELLWTIEDEFKLTLPSEPESLPTVGEVVRFIDTLIAAQHGSAAQRHDASVLSKLGAS